MMNSRQNASRPVADKMTREAATILFGEMLADVFPDRTVLGGAPFNVARHLTAFGQKPILISRLGDDALGRQMLDDMHNWGMDISGIQIDPERPTGRVHVHIEERGHHFEILPRQAYDFIDPERAMATLEAARPRLIYFGTLSQRHPTSRQALTSVLQHSPVPRFLDINLREPWHDEETLRFSLRHANIIKLNDDELRILIDRFGTDGTGDQAAELKSMFGIDHLIVTCGGDGAWQLDENNNVSSTPPGNKQAIVDTVGAGDAFAAVCILGMSLGWPKAAALKRANGFAAAICEIRGAVPQSHGFYQPFLKEWTL